MVIFYHFQNEGGGDFFYKFFRMEKNKKMFLWKMDLSAYGGYFGGAKRRLFRSTNF